MTRKHTRYIESYFSRFFYYYYLLYNIHIYKGDLNMLKNVISVIDGAAGSCGKSKVVGEIATDKRIRLGAAITNCMPKKDYTFHGIVLFSYIH